MNKAPFKDRHSISIPFALLVSGLATNTNALNEMLKQVQHDVMIRFCFFCHPEPSPEANSGSKDFGILVLDLEFIS
jgi:hypothetical protein